MNLGNMYKLSRLCDDRHRKGTCGRPGEGGGGRGMGWELGISWYKLVCIEWIDKSPLCSQGCCSVVQSCMTHCDPMDCSIPDFPTFTISRSLLKLMSIESVMPSNHLILCCPLFLLSSIFPRIRVFSYESALYIRWPKYCSFSFSITPSNEHSG